MLFTKLAPHFTVQTVKKKNHTMYLTFNILSNQHNNISQIPKRYHTRSNCPNNHSFTIHLPNQCVAISQTNAIASVIILTCYFSVSYLTLGLLHLHISHLFSQYLSFTAYTDNKIRWVSAMLF